MSFSSQSLSKLDKGHLLRDLRQRVADDFEALVRRQRDIQQGATHEENRAEHAKDTRATEQSYLARGLADRVAAIGIVADALAQLECRRFGSTEAIALTALVSLREERDRGAGTVRTCWIVPGPPGIDLHASDGTPIRTLTPAAPLGRALLGLRVGDTGRFASPAGERDFEILSIA